MATKVSKVSLESADDPLSLFAAQSPPAESSDEPSERTDRSGSPAEVSNSPAASSTGPSFSERVAAAERSAAEVSATLSIPTSISSLEQRPPAPPDAASTERNSLSDTPSSQSSPSANASSSSTMQRPLSVDGRSSVSATAEDEVEMYTGEMHLMKLKNLSLVKASGRHIPITLLMTTYRMMLMPTRSHAMALAQANPSVLSQLTIPLGTIEKIEKEKSKKSTGTTIVVHCKDIRQFRIYIPGVGDEIAATGITIMSDSEVERALGAMQAYSFPTDIRYVFAFAEAAALKGADKMQQHFRYDFTTEFIRQGVLDSDGQTVPCGFWRVSTENSEYKLCDTYPKKLIVPARISGEELHIIASFRSGRRLPALTWGTRTSAASIWRSAQPKTGMSSTCYQDESMLDQIATARGVRMSPNGLVRNLSEAMLAIIDCRPRTNAYANRAAGAGYELQKNYPNTRLEFYDIPNIHAVRDSFKALSALFQSYNGFVTQGGANVAVASDVSFGKAVEDTLWLQNIRLILRASWECACIAHKGTPVLVHCSHGWDRTSQVAALAQIFLDPYYRTFDGFQVLVEKDWISFGHPLLMRCGHVGSKDDEASPIFLQFLDCMYQLVRQFPHYFEFSPRYLLAIADHIYSCRFGTFLMNCDADRDRYGSHTRCRDIWTYLWENRDSLRSCVYSDPSGDKSSSTRLLMPPISMILRNVTLWTDYFFRFSVEPSAVPYPSVITKEILESYPIPSHLREENLKSHSPPKHPDFALLPSVTSQDFYEVLYMRERRRRLQLERSLGLPTPAETQEVKSDDGNAPSGDKDDHQSWSRSSEEVTSQVESEASKDTTFSGPPDAPNIATDPTKSRMTMVDIEASDDEEEEGAGSSATPWWVGHSLLNEISSRNPEEVKQLALHLLKTVQSGGVDISKDLSEFSESKVDSTS